MNKSTFMKELSKKLRGLSKEDYDEAMKYYEEFFQDAGVGEEEDVIPMVGSPGKVARDILGECLTKQENITKQEGTVKNSAKTLWLVILGALAAPLALPIIIVVAAVSFALIVTIGAIGISMLICCVSIVAVAIGMIPAVFWSGGAQSILILGIVLIGLGIGIFVFMLFEMIIKLLISLVIKIIKKISFRRQEQ